MPLPVAFVCSDCKYRMVINFNSDVLYTPACPRCGGSCGSPQKATAFEVLIARVKQPNLGKNYHHE